MALLLNIARRLCKLLCLVKDKSLIHLSYTNRTLSFILYSLYNVHAARYTQHTTGMIIYAQATHYTICLADTLRAVFASAALQAVFTSDALRAVIIWLVHRCLTHGCSPGCFHFGCSPGCFHFGSSPGCFHIGWYIDARHTYGCSPGCFHFGYSLGSTIVSW